MLLFLESGHPSGPNAELRGKSNCPQFQKGSGDTLFSCRGFQEHSTGYKVQVFRAKKTHWKVVNCGPTGAPKNGHDVDAELRFDLFLLAGHLNSSVKGCNCCKLKINNTLTNPYNCVYLLVLFFLP